VFFGQRVDDTLGALLNPDVLEDIGELAKHPVDIFQARFFFGIGIGEFAFCFRKLR
jgi:hypothetical protein